MSTTIKGKIALITGGTTGIGLSTARLFRDAGARVVITGQNADTLAAAAKELGPDVLVLKSDARSVQEADALSAELKSRFGRLDILFLNAGVARFAPIEGIDEAFYDDMMNVNVKGAIFTLQKVLPLLSEGASVLVNTSIVDQKGMPNASVYSASKGALSALVRALAAELASRGIRVNAISPGPITTPIYGKLGFPQQALAAFESDMIAKVPLHRFGGPEEVAQTALFLSSPAASYVTGVEVPVDGGGAIS